MKQIMIQDNEEMNVLRQRLRIRPLECDLYHHDQLDSRTPYEPHHYPRSNYYDVHF